MMDEYKRLLVLDAAIAQLNPGDINTSKTDRLVKPLSNYVKKRLKE